MDNYGTRTSNLVRMLHPARSGKPVPATKKSANDKWRRHIQYLMRKHKILAPHIAEHCSYCVSEIDAYLGAAKVASEAVQQKIEAAVTQAIDGVAEREVEADRLRQEAQAQTKKQEANRKLRSQLSGWGDVERADRFISIIQQIEEHGLTRAEVAIQCMMSASVATQYLGRGREVGPAAMTVLEAGLAKAIAAKAD